MLNSLKLARLHKYSARLDAGDDPVGAALAAKRLVQAISILVTQQGVGQRMHGKERQQRDTRRQ
ncbi:hypothetical protein, partial [Pseudomonas sp.]|uniref:hypothetical protein n=1 Tax=Pseudomonas sp. TaxID=306 RepID=UPI0028AB79E3